MLFSKQCVRHNAPLFFCFVCWMITIPYTVDFDESKSSMTACFFFVHSSRCCQIVSKAPLNARSFFLLQLGNCTFTQEGMNLASNTKCQAHTGESNSFFFLLFFCLPLPESDCRSQTITMGAEKSFCAECSILGVFIACLLPTNRTSAFWVVFRSKVFLHFYPSFVCFAYQFLFPIPPYEENDC